jgi:signal transduction histidine kinase
MKRRIRSIFLLMVVCMVGINGFQAYWLYTTYQLTASQFARTVRDALATVVQRQQVNAARQLLGPQAGQRPKRIVYATFGNDASQPGRVVVIPRARPDSAHAAPRHPHQKVEMTVTTTTTSTRTSSGNAVDTLARSISRLIINDWAGPRTIDLRQFATAYHAELRQRAADASFVLDTLRLKPALGERALAPPRHLPASYTLLTPPTLLNPVTDLQVRAAFEPPTSYVLRRMGGLLLGSGLLLALTTACFLLMLSTILKQKKLSDVKNDFINNMTHELKTPLATVSAAVEALQNFGALNDPAKTRTYLSISRIELQRLSDLVEKVLNIAVEEREQLELRPEAVQPAELVAEIVARHQLQATKPVKFDVEVAPAPAVSFDRLHMGNVINNLIDNAIKYSREAVTITIRGRQEPSGWHLTVADNGPGIEPNYQQAIFDRFFRVPTGNLHNVKGFGLGLYYVRQVVERHGGRIDVRSGLGRGSEFALWIPATA